MALKQIVTLKGQKDGIEIFLDPKADFEEVKNSLRKKVSQGKKFFGDADTRVSFKGRAINELNEKILIDIITEETNLEIKTNKAVHEKKTAAAKTEAPIFNHHEKPPAPVPVQSKQGYKESPTAYYYSGLRSGQRIKYSGSVVIMGDVNPGSEIIADGNVVVLGTLKGMAHAGANGDDTCFVSALSLQPTQLRIAGTISYVPKDAKNARSSAAYAYIKDGQVFIGPL